MTQPHLEYFSPPATGFDPLRQLSLTSLCTLEVGESVPVLLLFLSTCMETKKRFYTATDLSDDTREFLSLEVILWSTFLFFLNILGHTLIPRLSVNTAVECRIQGFVSQ